MSGTTGAPYPTTKTVAIFSPDSNRIATILPGNTVFDDHFAQLWNGHSGEAIAVLEANVSNVAFNGNGLRGATTSWGPKLRLWDSNSGAELGVFDGHNGDFADVAFGANGQLLTASWDHTARLWPMFSTTMELVEFAKMKALRCLTKEERSRFFLDEVP